VTDAVNLVPSSPVLRKKERVSPPVRLAASATTCATFVPASAPANVTL
jgi:hypothetical protein